MLFEEFIDVFACIILHLVSTGNRLKPILQCKMTSSSSEEGFIPIKIVTFICAPKIYTIEGFFKKITAKLMKVEYNSFSSCFFEVFMNISQHVYCLSLSILDEC